ncbi:hypothetical protein GCM10010265_54750 [Streptomyces griseoincarnatus]|nr:hypothetical protein GCM10010265_54750 [Streptomyces griseoincarnatus]
MDVGSVAWAAGAARRAAGTIAAVAAAAARARRSFMKTSVSPACRAIAARVEERLRVGRAGLIPDVGEFDHRDPRMVVLDLTESLRDVDHAQSE